MNTLLDLFQNDEENEDFDFDDISHIETPEQLQDKELRTKGEILGVAVSEFDGIANLDIKALNTKMDLILSRLDKLIQLQDKTKK